MSQQELCRLGLPDQVGEPPARGCILHHLHFVMLVGPFPLPGALLSLIHIWAPQHLYLGGRWQRACGRRQQGVSPATLPLSAPPLRPTRLLHAASRTWKALILTIGLPLILTITMIAPTRCGFLGTCACACTYSCTMPIHCCL